MQLDTYLQMGSFHTHHCEDSLITAGITLDVELIAVMDGCSSGTDSFFVSTMAAKLLRRIANEYYHLDFKEPLQIPLPKLLEKVLQQFMAEMRFLQNRLQLSQYEMLCTLVLALVDTRKRLAEVIVVGDGYVSCNGQGWDFDHDNRPDYLGYHLAENFTDWFCAQTQRMSFQAVRELSISTDGIQSFRPADTGEYPPLSEQEIVDLLLHAPEKIRGKVGTLRTHYGLVPADDLGIVRMVLDQD